MTRITSNRLTDLSERIRQAQDRAKAASVEAAEQSIEAGQLLIEAKAECKHGEWGLPLPPKIENALPAAPALH